MFRKIQAWYNGVVTRAVERQERKLAEELAEIKLLPRTPERQHLIEETEALLLSGSASPSDSYLGAKIDATSADITKMRGKLAVDATKDERAKLSARIAKLAAAAKKLD